MVVVSAVWTARLILNQMGIKWADGGIYDQIEAPISFNLASCRCPVQLCWNGRYSGFFEPDFCQNLHQLLVI